MNKRFQAWSVIRGRGEDAYKVNIYSSSHDAWKKAYAIRESSPGSSVDVVREDCTLEELCYLLEDNLTEEQAKPYLRRSPMFAL